MDAKIIEMLEEINGDVLYKNSATYDSYDWRLKKDCDCIFPIQRKLGRYECVFDLDGIDEMDMQFIPQWLDGIGFKFMAWQTSDSGMHIHFWTDMFGKEIKKEIVRQMVDKLEKKFGVVNDIGPMGHGHIRAEYSIHPKKLTVKKLLKSNISPLFYKNELSLEMKQKVSKMASLGPVFTPAAGVRDGKTPTCVRYMLSNTFSDGRERIIFALISWWKASGLTDDQIFKNVTEWCMKQHYQMSSAMIMSKIKCSKANVGCRYRHALLEELGHPVHKCEWK